MEVKFGQEKQPMAGVKSRGGKIPSGSTMISPNLKKQSVVLDRDGNQIDLATKRIIKYKVSDETK